MRKTILATFAAVLAIPVAAAARQPVVVTGEMDYSPFERVSYADLDIRSDGGISTLKSRVRRAATRLCITEGPDPLKLVMDGRACFKAAVADANGQIHLAQARWDSSRLAAAASFITVTAR
jgi:UrcA family protein